MEQYVVCALCGEKNSTAFSYCKKCGSELLFEEIPNQSSQKIQSQPINQEEVDIDRLPTSDDYIKDSRRLKKQKKGIKWSSITDGRRKYPYPRKLSRREEIGLGTVLLFFGGIAVLAGLFVGGEGFIMTLIGLLFSGIGILTLYGKIQW